MPASSARRRRGSTGSFSVTSPGISERVNDSAPNLGAAISKAQNIATRLQRELRATENEDDVTIRIRRLGGELVARVIVRRNVIETYVDHQTEGRAA